VNNIAGETNKSHFRSNEQMHFTKKQHIKIIQQRNRKKKHLYKIWECVCLNVTKLSKYTFNSFFCLNKKIIQK